MKRLEQVVIAQEQFRLQNVVDQDADGMGEFGWLGELAGVDPVRISGLSMNAWPFVPPEMGFKQADGAVRCRGFRYRMHLPTERPDLWLAEALVPAKGQSEGPFTLVNGLSLPDRQETRYVCYAWPDQGSQWVNSTFVVAGGAVWTVRPELEGAPPYAGDREPKALAAFTADGTRIADGRAGERGQDGRLWVPYEGPRR